MLHFSSTERCESFFWKGGILAQVMSSMMHLKRSDPKELLRSVEEVHKGSAEGLNCSERVFLVIHSLLETDVSSESVALMSGFGGGVAGTRDNMCGAVSGGVAGIGLVYGRRAPPKGNRDRVYEVSKDFVGRFKTRFGTTICGELIGDLLREATEESEEKRKARCSQYTLNAAKMCAETLLKYESLYPDNSARK
jgi:C_GCAxxG_C_C family probable redox protein